MGYYRSSPSRSPAPDPRAEPAGVMSLKALGNTVSPLSSGSPSRRPTAHASHRADQPATAQRNLYSAIRSPSASSEPTPREQQRGARTSSRAEPEPDPVQNEWQRVEKGTTMLQAHVSR